MDRKKLLGITVLVAFPMAIQAAEPLKASGVVEPFRRVKIGARATGVIESVPDTVKEGAVVKEGDVLAKMDDYYNQCEVDRQTELEKYYRIQAERMRTLVNDKAESQSKLDEALAYAGSVSATLKREKKTLANMTLLVPKPGGIITRQFKQIGESAQEREDMFEIINVDTVYFFAYFKEKDYGRVKIGQPAIATLDVNKNEKFEGKVYFVDSEVEAGSGQFRVRVELQNLDHRITAGLKGTITIVEGENAAAAR